MGCALSVLLLGAAQPERGEPACAAESLTGA